MLFSADLIAAIFSFLFTILILTYLVGDNPLFRIAAYLFVGVSAGYVAAVVWWQVLTPRLFQPFLPVMLAGSLAEKIILLVPLLGSAFILMKISPRLAGMARITMAFLVGAGAGVILGGAVLGTLIPQTAAAVNFFNREAALARNIGLEELLFNGSIILVGLVSTLIYFHFGARVRSDGSVRRLGVIEAAAWVGRIFIGITLGAVFAGMYAAALTALIERLASLIDFLNMFRNF